MKNKQKKKDEQKKSHRSPSKKPNSEISEHKMQTNHLDAINKEQTNKK